MLRSVARRRSPPGEPRLVGYLYVLPAFAFFAIFGIVPFIQTIGISFTEWRGVGEQEPVGLDNYVAVVNDPDLYSAFFRSLVLIFFYSFVPVAIGLLLAALLSRVRIRGMGAYRVLLFLPQTIALVVVAIAWVLDLLGGRSGQPGPPAHRARGADAVMAGGLRPRAARRSDSWARG